MLDKEGLVTTAMLRQAQHDKAGLARAVATLQKIIKRQHGLLKKFNSFPSAKKEFYYPGLLHSTPFPNFPSSLR
jgi:hypothetical protein